MDEIGFLLQRSLPNARNRCVHQKLQYTEISVTLGYAHIPQDLIPPHVKINDLFPVLTPLCTCFQNEKSEQAAQGLRAWVYAQIQLSWSLVSTIQNSLLNKGESCEKFTFSILTLNEIIINLAQKFSFEMTEFSRQCIMKGWSRTCLVSYKIE